LEDSQNPLLNRFKQKTKKLNRRFNFAQTAFRSGQILFRNKFEFNFKNQKNARKEKRKELFYRGNHVNVRLLKLRRSSVYERRSQE
jgi:hypothetical protein